MTAENVTFLNPVGVVKTREKRLAARLPTLDGKAMGIMDDCLTNCDPILEGLAGEIKKQFELAGVVSTVKPSQSSPLPRATFEEFLRQVDFVVVGVGV